MFPINTVALLWTPLRLEVHSELENYQCDPCKGEQAHVRKTWCPQDRAHIFVSFLSVCQWHSQVDMCRDLLPAVPQFSPLVIQSEH